MLIPYVTRSAQRCHEKKNIVSFTKFLRVFDIPWTVILQSNEDVEETMKKSVNHVAALAAVTAISFGLGLAGFSSQGFADRGGEPNSHSQGNGGQSGSAGVGGGGEIGAGFSAADPGTVGPAISGELYGNTSNPSGSGQGVLPSLSPGPWLCNGVDCSAQPTTSGPSMGELLAPIGSGGNANPDFANGKDPGPDFSEPNKP